MRTKKQLKAIHAKKKARKRKTDKTFGTGRDIALLKREENVFGRKKNKDSSPILGGGWEE